MSDSVDRDHYGKDRPLSEPLMGGDWTETDAPVRGPQPDEHGVFEGATSLLEPSKPQTKPGANLDPASEQNLRSLLKDVEKLKRSGQIPEQEPLSAESTYVGHFLARARMYLEARAFKASLEALHDGLKLVPGNARLLAMIDEVRAASERRQVELEESGLANRMSQCKAEAVSLFEQGRYADCIERFKVLSELDPANSDLRHYLEVSREQAEKAARPEPALPMVEPHRETVGAPSLTSSLSAEAPVVAQPLSSERSANEDLVDLEAPVQELTDPMQPDLAVARAAESYAGDESPTETPVAVQFQQLRQKAREEQPITAQDNIDVDSDLPEDPAEVGSKKFRIACLAGVGLVVGAMLGAWLALSPTKVTQELASTSFAGNAVSVVEPEQPAALADGGAVPEGEDPQLQAEKAFQQGKLLEANRFCDAILQSTPDDAFALDLKQQIRDRYSKMAAQATARQDWSEVSMAWHNFLKVAPGDREAMRQLKAAKANLKQEEQTALASKLERERRIEELHQQISRAMDSGRHLPPSSGSALEFIEQLESLAPEDGFAGDQRSEIVQQLSASANRLLQAKDWHQAGAVVRQLEKYFPDAPDLNRLREGLKAEAARLFETRNAWMQKAEAAMAAGRFVTPASDNAIAYCHELLVAEPQNAKALELRKTSIAKALLQGKAWTQEGRFDDARAVYSALLYLPHGESLAGATTQELKAEIEKLTLNAYAVVHDHALGSCSGRLRYNGYQVSYVPSSDSKDGFSVKLTEVSQVDADDKLKIQLKGRTYRFQMNGTKDPQEIKTKLSTIQKQLSTLAAAK